MSPRMKNVLGVAWMSAAIFATILLVQWAVGQERPPVAWYEESTLSPTDTTVPVAEPVTAVPSVVTLTVEPMSAAPGVSAMPTTPTPPPSLPDAGGLPSEPVAAMPIPMGGMPMSVEPSTANAGVVAISAPAHATVEVPAISRPAPWSPYWASITTEETDTANTTALILACDDDEALREHLANHGITVRESGPGGSARPARSLPQNFLVGVTAYEYAGAYCDTDQAMLENVPPPGDVTVLRFVNNSTAAVKFALAHPERKFLVIADIHGLSTDALRVLAGDNVIGVVVGHYRHADDEPTDFAAAAADVLRVTRAVRLVNDAPVLLAVGAVNIHTRDTERAWADAFGDDVKLFDGFALYGLVRFPAILEAAENPRTLILRRMGLPDKPCVLLEFTGTSFQYAAAERPYVEKVWAARAKPLLAALKTQGFRGLVTWSATLDDATIKADALRSAMK